MKDVYPAMLAKMAASGQLRGLMNKLTQGGDGEPIDKGHPHIDVTGEIVEEMPSYTQDIRVYSITCELFSNHREDKKVSEAMAIFRETYHHKSLESPAFHTVEMRVTNQRGPWRDPETKLMRGTFVLRLEIEMLVASPQTAEV